MKKIINNKLYDTDKSTYLGSLSFGTQGSFDFCSDDLYVTSRGAYFIATITFQNDACIRLLTFEDARMWSMENLSADEFIVYFGEVEEG